MIIELSSVESAIITMRRGREMTESEKIFGRRGAVDTVTLSTRTDTKKTRTTALDSRRKNNTRKNSH